MYFCRLLLVLSLGAVSFAQTAPAPAQAGATQASPSPSSTSGKSATSQKSTDAPQGQSNSAAERERSGADPLLDLPPLPNAKMTVIGGTVAKLDRVRDRLILRPFGSKDEMKLAFDLRTKITQNGQPVALKDIKPGSRVYADTMLNGEQVFARNIRIEGQAGQGDARGQVVAYDQKSSVLSLREQVSPEPVRLKVTPQTQIEISKKPASIAELRPGALVVINFAPGTERLGEAQRIQVLANPGESFKFVGKITFVDMRSKRFAIANQSDNETYDITLGPVPSQTARSLREGQNAVVSAVFNGQTYEARAIEITSPSTQQAESKE
jgi:hypothetical protein